MPPWASPLILVSISIPSKTPPNLPKRKTSRIRGLQLPQIQEFFTGCRFTIMVHRLTYVYISTSRDVAVAVVAINGSQPMTTLQAQADFAELAPWLSENDTNWELLGPVTQWWASLGPGVLAHGGRECHRWGARQRTVCCSTVWNVHVFSGCGTGCGGPRMYRRVYSSAKQRPSLGARDSDRF